jgi:hypothetical protein
MDERLVAACRRTDVDAIADAVVAAARMLVHENDSEGGFTARAVHELEAALDELHLHEEPDEGGGAAVAAGEAS